MGADDHRHAGARIGNDPGTSLFNLRHPDQLDNNKPPYYVSAVTDRLDFLLADVARLQRRAFDERARLIGVTGPQWRLLTTLFRNEGINQGMLAELLEVEPITLCRMVDRLAESGLIERRANPQDRRAWQLHLTAKAHPVIAQLRSLADAQYRETTEGLDLKMQEVLKASLERMRSNLSRRTVEAANG
jgi:DNA-binding MarR family transcriptional regulator